MIRFRECDIRAAEHPDQRHEGGADEDREEQPGELELPDVLDEVILGGQQHDAAAIPFADDEFGQPEQVILSVVVADKALVVVDGYATA